MYTNDMKFIASHEWVRLSEDNTAYIGITQHAQELLGDLVYVELPPIGKKITVKTTIGVLESVKAASDLYTPVSGEVIKVNDNVINDPTLINTKPHTDGWLIQIKLDNPTDLDKLMSADEYQKSIG